MKKIGITGGIGSGKTTVCKLFETLDVPVFYADEISRSIVDTDSKVIHSIIEQFGANVYAYGKLDRKKMASIVFNDKEKLNQLNAIIHPAVGKAFNTFCEKHKKQSYIIKEAAILFETGLNKELDKVIVVTASINERISRVMKRDSVSKSEVENRINSQMPQEEKIKLADFVIHNSNGELVIPQVLNIHKQLIA